jgi:hypothetical protein
MANHDGLMFSVILFALIVRHSQSASVLFETTALRDPNGLGINSETAVAFATDSFGNIYIAGQETYPNHTSRFILYKTNANRKVMWSVPGDIVDAAKGIVVLTDPNTKIASAFVSKYPPASFTVCSMHFPSITMEVFNQTEMNFDFLT